MRISLYAVLLITNVVPFAYSLRCGYGYRMNGTIPGPPEQGFGPIPTTNPFEQGFQQMQCNNDVQFCVTVTNDLVGGITVKQKFCDGQWDAIEVMPNTFPTCQSFFSGNAGCMGYDMSSVTGGGLWDTVRAQICCCNSDLCNCDQTSATSANYCAVDPVTTQKPTITTQKPTTTTQEPTTTTQKPTITTTSNASSLNKIISSFLAVFIYFAVR